MNIITIHCKNRPFYHTESRYYQYFAYKLWVLEKIAIHYFFMHNSFEFPANLLTEKNQNNLGYQFWLLIRNRKKRIVPTPIVNNWIRVHFSCRVVDPEIENLWLCSSVVNYHCLYQSRRAACSTNFVNPLEL